MSFSSVQSLGRDWLFVTPWTAAHQASLSIINSQSLLKLMPIQLMMPSNHLILCCPLLLLPSIFVSIRVFSNESVLQIRWPKNPPAMWETWIWFLGWEDPLEKGIPTPVFWPRESHGLYSPWGRKVCMSLILFKTYQLHWKYFLEYFKVYGITHSPNLLVNMKRNIWLQLSVRLFQ